MRTCLFFGSFNPIHYGHLALAEYARDILGCKEVWLILSPLNPHKKKSELLPYSLRRDFIVHCLKGRTGIRLIELERYLPSPLYTVRSVQALKLLSPKRDFSLLIGGDNLAMVPTWYKWERLLELVHLYVYPRVGYNGSLSLIPHQVCQGAPEFDISSTLIRDLLSKGEDISHLTDPSFYKLLGDSRS